MPLWKVKASRREDEPAGDAVVVVSGSIRSPYEADALRVELTILDVEITMRADDTVLGSWPVTALDIRRIDPRAFEFTAEGDRMIFTPDDPSTFGDSTIVRGHDAGTDNSKGRKSKKKRNEAEPRLAGGRGSPGRERGPRRVEEQDSPQERPRKLSQRRRKATAEAIGAEAARAEVVPDPPSAVPGPIDATLEGEQPVAVSSSSDGRHRSDSPHEPPVLDPDIDDTVPREPKGKRTGAWIRTLDIARRYDAFGLDRVPVDVTLRGQEHQHTWDHRVAATSGLGKHVCTICGAIRR